MISRLDFPSEVRFSTYLRVRSSRLMRSAATTCKALLSVTVTSSVETVPDHFARRSWNRGNTAHYEQKPTRFSIALRSSPTATKSVCRSVDPDAMYLYQIGGGFRNHSLQLPIEFANLRGEIKVTAGDGSKERTWWLPATSSGTSPGRKLAALRTNFAVESLRNSALNSSGAVMSIALSWLAAWARAFTAERRAARSTRTHLDSSLRTFGFRQYPYPTARPLQRSPRRWDQTCQNDADLGASAGPLLGPRHRSCSGSDSAPRRRNQTPSIPTRSSSPRPSAHLRNFAYPASVVGTDKVPRHRPRWSRATATCSSR